METKQAQPPLAFDYRNQAWLSLYAKVNTTGAWLWQVEPCGHPENMRPGCCYAGEHAGEVVVHHAEIH